VASDPRGQAKRNVIALICITAPHLPSSVTPLAPPLKKEKRGRGKKAFVDPTGAAAVSASFLDPLHLLRPEAAPSRLRRRWRKRRGERGRKRSTSWRGAAGERAGGAGGRSVLSHLERPSSRRE